MELQGRRRTVVLLCTDTRGTSFLFARKCAAESMLKGSKLNVSAVQYPRTDPWPLVHSPFPVTLLFAFYLLVVALGPFYMRPRKPLKLRGLLVAYNLAMMMLSSYMFYEVRRQDWLLGKHLGSQMARVCWWFFFSKVIELLDTVFFILRKKQEQVTFLHVYHHGTMLFNWWSGVKYVPGGQAFFIGMLNSFVHIFMYGYYALASLGPRMHPYLWWKRYLTIMQLVITIAAHSSYNLFTECPFPDGFNAAVFLYILSLIALFLRFYYQTYIRGNVCEACVRTSQLNAINSGVKVSRSTLN
uniref:Elongation of very long chain fatty acids protein n=1 Tax=Buteo japonicus TaxID=224669 RepID=A0A8C0BU57_9AVES